MSEKRPILDTHDTGYLRVDWLEPGDVGHYLAGFVKEGLCFRADYDRDTGTLIVILTGGY